MKFFQRLKDGAGKVTDKAQNAVEINRMNTQITNIEREMGVYFQRMGEVFYEGYRAKDMSLAEKEMLELAKTCDLLFEERAELRIRIAELKNERLCDACGRAVTEEALFCQYCGHKLAKVKSPSEVVRRSERLTDMDEYEVDHDSVFMYEPERDGSLYDHEDIQEQRYVAKDDPLLPDILARKVTAAGYATEERNDGVQDGYKSPGIQSSSSKGKRTGTYDLSVLRKIATPSSRMEEAPPAPEDVEKRQRVLEMERKRQEELERRIRTWQENTKLTGETAQPAAAQDERISCNVCLAHLVKGTRWCPHCGSEQL